jgi:hypothetical protein
MKKQMFEIVTMQWDSQPTGFCVDPYTFDLYTRDGIVKEGYAKSNHPEMFLHFNLNSMVGGHSYVRSISKEIYDEESQKLKTNPWSELVHKGINDEFVNVYEIAMNKYAVR